MSLIKIWNVTREKKVFIVGTKMLTIPDVIAKASSKLGINGAQLVIEKDGTQVEDDEVLNVVKSEVMILLAHEERWQPMFFDSMLEENNFAINDEHQEMEIVDVKGASTSQEENASLIGNGSSSAIGHNSIEILSNISSVSTQPLPLNVTYVLNQEYLWQNFNVPWDKLSGSLIQLLEKGDRQNSTKSSVVHMVVSEMRNQGLEIPSKAFRYVAGKVVNKFPDTFRDIDEDGVVIGDGTLSLFYKLKDRNNYLNRPHKSNENKENPIGKKKKSAAKAGCTNWNPKIMPIEQVDEKLTLEEKKKVEYAQQREFINQKARSVQEILEAWPDLLTLNGICYHFELLTEVNLELLDLQFSQKCKKILQLDKENQIKLINIDEDIAIKTIKVLCWHFKENLNSFFIEEQEETDINAIIKKAEPSPSIIMTNRNTFYVVLEGALIQPTAYTSFTIALKVAFAMYFILNLEFPKNFSKVLELIQRYIFKIHPVVGSKSSKQLNAKSSVIKLINKLKKMPN